MKNIDYIGNCVSLNIYFLEEIQKKCKEIRYETIRKKLGVNYLNSFFGYDKKTLNIKNDYHIRFFSSSFIYKNKKIKVYIVVHSAIEYVFQVKF